MRTIQRNVRESIGAATTSGIRIWKATAPTALHRDNMTENTEWRYYMIFDFCDETSVTAAIDAFVSDDLGLFDAGYRHFHLDDCWAGGRNSSGYLFPEKNNRPNGMKPVIDYAHSKGVVFGLYTCAGTLTCVGRRPGSKDHWKEDASLWASHLTLPWIGYAYIGCYLVHLYNIHHIYLITYMMITPKNITSNIRWS